MKKKILLRGLIGLPVGISIGHLISVITSLIWGGGAYSPCVPELVSSVGNEVGAVLLQTILCAVIGAVFAGASLIWEIKRWSIVRQTGVYFLLCGSVLLSAAYILYWMERSFWGALQYLGIFAAIFFVIWLTQYGRIARNVKKMNQTLQKQKEDNKTKY